jgi:hypothetical protein
MKLGNFPNRRIQVSIGLFHLVFTHPRHWFVKYLLEDFHSMQDLKRENSELLED